MRAVLMAGGSGTRLRPLTCDLPKPMVPILNRPIAEHIIRLLKQHHITNIVATLFYLPDVMRDYFRDGADLGVTLTYAVEEEQALGTAGCVKNVGELLDDTFLVISGDSITDFDLQAAIRFHKENNAKATLVLTRVPNPIEFGVVITDPTHRIVRFLEKPTTSEIFSDTINTGIYILEPEVLDDIPANCEQDFSKDLFPLLLEKGDPLYGYVAEGYWCDVGHLDAYRQAQYDALHGKINLDYAASETTAGVYVGINSTVDTTAKLKGPILIGDNCRIGARAVLSPGTVIGDNVTIGNDARLERAIAWNGALIGDESHLRACVVSRGSRIARRVHLLEGSIIGSLTTVGEEAKVSPGVKVWPSKLIEAGAILNINLIWGHTAHRNLFGQRGVVGLANIDITPEFAVKLGAAYGSTLKLGAAVSVSRDQRSISRMIARSLIAGLMSVGVNVLDLEAVSIPVVHSILPALMVVGGIHVRLHPKRTDHLLIEFFNSDGLDIAKSKEKKIEGAYFKEDLRRAQVSEIGSVTYPDGVVDNYNLAFEKHLNTAAIRCSKSKVVIDYAYALSGAVLPQILDRFGCDAVVLNASLAHTAPSLEERDDLLGQLGQVVHALKATFGVQVSANGEQLILVDEVGTPIRGETLTALMVHMILTAHPGGTVVVPVQSSGAIEEITRRHGGRVIRTQANSTALMAACTQQTQKSSQPSPYSNTVVLGGSGDMGFIFPQMHPGFDAMFCIAKLIEMLVIQERSLGHIWEELPRIAHRSQTMRCPWRMKGSLMRYLVETHSPDQLDLTDGVKIMDPDRQGNAQNWVLVLPDASEPIVHIFANSKDRDWVDAQLLSYQQRLQLFISSAQGLDEL
ncbi:MAG: mannose-1-phosphate guanyltransferase [Cyanobacteria bacterium P01_D01_bin.105]